MVQTSLIVHEYKIKLGNGNIVEWDKYEIVTLCNVSYVNKESCFELICRFNKTVDAITCTLNDKHGKQHIWNTHLCSSSDRKTVTRCGEQFPER